MPVGPRRVKFAPALRDFLVALGVLLQGSSPAAAESLSQQSCFLTWRFFSLLAPSLGSHLFPCLFLFLDVSFDLTDSIAIRLSLFNASTKVCTKCLGTRETTLIYCVREDPENVDYFTPKKNQGNSQLD